MGNKRTNHKDFQILSNAEPEKENLLVTLSNRRHQNAKQQIKTVILESYELFGETFTEEVISECKEIYSEYKNLTE